jgi:adenylyltransferase/sulfurtransferase
MNPNTKNLRSEILSLQEIRRYASQINTPSFGLKGQEKLKQAKVLVVGAGGKGTTVLQNLATLGVGKLGISDDFIIEEHELSRQHLYGNADLGKQKAIISKQKLMEINHFVDYELHNVCLSETNIKSICKNYDILIDTTDNFSSRYLINDTAISLGKPMIIGMVYRSKGFVSVLNHLGGPSFRCLYPEKPDDSKVDNSDDFVCNVSLMNVVGSLVANETIKIILGISSKLFGNVLKFDAGNFNISLEKIDKKEENFR